jgi:peptidoglycan/xylan/chitin deacetylase (PgdA/CDA1 family)
MYHRVADPDLDPWLLCVRPAHFEAHLRVLADRGSVVTLEDLAGGTARRPAVVVTIDDGYEDTLSAASPLLDRYDVPATVYVMTAGLREQHACWWDVLTELLLRPGRLPDELPARFRGPGGAAVPPGAGAYGPEEARRHATWSAYDPPATPRHQLYLSLWHWLVERPPAEQALGIDELRRWTGRPGTPAARLLSAPEVRTLTTHPGVTIGAHTVRHPALPALQAAEQQREVTDSVRQLEATVARPVEHFAYPHGRHDVASREVVAASGFRTAVTTDPGSVDPHSDPLVLPRHQVPDVDGGGFTAWLDGLHEATP